MLYYRSIPLIGAEVMAMRREVEQNGPMAVENFLYTQVWKVPLWTRHWNILGMRSGILQGLLADLKGTAPNSGSLERYNKYVQIILE